MAQGTPMNRYSVRSDSVLRKAFPQACPSIHQRLISGDVMRLSVQAPPARRCFLRWREKREELPHCRRSDSPPGKHLDAKAFEHQAQNALVLIECGGPVSYLGGRRADKNCHD